MTQLTPIQQFKMIDQSRRQKLKILVEHEAARWGLTVEDILGSSRSIYIVACRHLIWAMVKEQFYIPHVTTVEWLGRYFNRDHRTFTAGARRGERLLRSGHYPPINGGHHPYFSNKGDHLD